MRVYEVGGSLRDEMLGLEAKDRDWLVVGSSVQEMLDMGYKQVGKQFPVMLHPETGQEYALARKERSTDDTHNGFECVVDDVTLEEDVRRRDLSINGLVRDESGELIDLVGGLFDIQNKVFRHVSNAFVEDPIRPLRIARFASKFGHDWTIPESTLDLIAEMKSKGMFKNLCKERVYVEYSGAMMGDNPRAFFDFLCKMNILDEIFPLIDKLRYSYENPKHHNETGEYDLVSNDWGCTYEHTMRVLQLASENLALDRVDNRNTRLEVLTAALLHDVGKTDSNRRVIEGKMNFGQHHGHDRKLHFKLIDQFSEKCKLPRKTCKIAKSVLEHHMKAHDYMSRSKYGSFVDMLFDLDRKQAINVYVRVCKADSQVRTNPDLSDVDKINYINAIWLAIKDVWTDQVLSLKDWDGTPSPLIGDKIRQQRISIVKTMIRIYKGI